MGSSWVKNTLLLLHNGEGREWLGGSQVAFTVSKLMGDFLTGALDNMSSLDLRATGALSGPTRL